MYKYKDRNEKRKALQRFKIEMLFLRFLLLTQPDQFYFMILEKQVKEKIQSLQTHYGSFFFLLFSF